jgi:hypothetical protein
MKDVTRPGIFKANRSDLFITNRNTRDELSHNIFLMLQECNKFREHQAREMLIELLDRQLTMRRKLLAEIQLETAEADRLI